jgi:type I restriction enzyme S subunit
VELPQQKKIAKILSTVDAVIEKTESAIAKYQAIKQGLMHDLFTRGIDVNTGKLRPTPQDVPDLYKESALGLIPKDWEVKKSLELMTFYNGRAYSITEWEDKGTPVIRLQNLTGSGNDFYYSNLKLPDHQYCHRGDLLYMWSATFGPHIWQGPKAIYHYHIWKVACNEHLYCKDFAHIELSRFTEKVMQTSQGSTMAHITKGGMEERIMSVPQLKEQNIISDSLNSLKTKIQTEQQALGKYQQLKTGLLQDLLMGKVAVSVE